MNGLECCKALTAGDLRRLLVHAAPAHAQIEVVADDRQRASSDRPERSGEYAPMTELRLDSDARAREEVWPTEDHFGPPVLLPGGDVGLLTAWRHPDDLSWWQWSVEFSNHRDRPADWQPESGKLRRLGASPR